MKQFAMAPSRLGMTVWGWCLVTVLGCSGSSSLVQVEGVVTLGGQPLPEATVVLSPVTAAGPGPFVGTTDAQGRFSLSPSAEPDWAGAAPGTYRLTISTIKVEPTEGGDEAVPKVLVPERVPPAYRTGNIRFEVPEEGTTSANFDLGAR